MAIIKNTLTIVQGEPQEEQPKTVTATGGNGTTLIKTQSGFYINPNTSNGHGILQSDMSNTLFVNLNGCTSFRIIVKFKFNSLGTEEFNSLFGSGNYSPFIFKGANNKISAHLYNSSKTASEVGPIDYEITSDVWYYAALRWENGKSVLALYSNSGELLGSKIKTWSYAFYNTNYNSIWFGGSNNSYWVGRNLDMDISECLYEKNGVAQWGATNAKTANMGIITPEE